MDNTVTLRKVTESDAHLLVRWRNENKNWFPPQPDFTLGGQYRWFWDKYLTNPHDHYFLVCVGDRKPVGTMSIDSRTHEIGRVMLGDTSYARKGVMSAALRELRLAFPARSYCLQVLSSNVRAIAFYRKNGFDITSPASGLGADDDMIWMVTV